MHDRSRSGTRRDFVTALGVGAGAALLTGCRLGKESAPHRAFVLQAPPAPAAGPETGGAPAGVLLVRPFRVAPAFDSRSFVVRRGESEFATDAYNGFLGSPGTLLTEALAGWVRGLGVFATVLTGGSQLPPSHALEGEVTALYGDYRDPARPAAVLALQLRLLHPLVASSAAVRWEREERRTIPLEKAGAEELVSGWNRALAEICGSFDAAAFRRLPAANPSQPQA